MLQLSNNGWRVATRLVSALSLGLCASACVGEPVDDLAPSANDDTGNVESGITFVADPASYFDGLATGSSTFSQAYRLAGSFTPPAFSWGQIDLLEGRQKFRTEGYNNRTAKLRWQDTFEDSTYPLRTYYGALNQHLVDGFNLFYKNACAGTVGSTSAANCPAKGPTRPEARFVLLHHGPNTAKGLCDKTKTPVLLVHGAMQNANVWLRPGGDNGGQLYPGQTQATGFVQALEAQNYCTYAVTFGNFHGDNFNQAIHIANALSRVRSLTGKPKVNLVAWSKGVVAADLYMSNPASWADWGPKYFEQLAALQAKNVPNYRSDVRTYVALSGPHLGIDLNFRHPFNPLLIYSTAENAPLGQGPVTWSYMSAVQCVTWGLSASPNDIFPNPYAYSVCENRGGMWPDFWRRIYTSNITGLDATGAPVAPKTLKQLNIEQGASDPGFSFDKYNLAMWGSVDDSGKFVSPYLGQMQVSYDLRPQYPIPNREDDPVSYDWSKLDTDEAKWREWISLKTNYNPANVFGGAGWVSDDAGHTTCRATAFDPAGFPCRAKHMYYDTLTAESYSLGYAQYKLMDGLGIKTVMEMGGNLIDRLRKRGLSTSLDYLYVLHGTSGGASGQVFEIDGMDCPTCDPKGDGVLFNASIAARTQLTQGWTAANVTAKSKQEGVPFGHLEVGVTPAVWQKMITQFNSLP